MMAAVHWGVIYFLASDSAVAKLDFELEPEPPPAPPRASSLGEICESSSEIKAPDVPSQASN